MDESYEFEVPGVEVYSDVYAPDYDPETGELTAPAVEVAGPPEADGPDKTGWQGLPEVPELERTPEELKALSFDEKQKYAMALQGYITYLTRRKEALIAEVADFNGNAEYIKLKKQTVRSMTISQRKEWDQELLGLASQQRILAKSVTLSAEYTSLIQTFSRMSSVVQTVLRAEMAEGNLTP